MLLPFIGNTATHTDAVKILVTIVIKGNAKEVFLKCTEGLRSIVWQRESYHDDDGDGEAAMTKKLAFDDQPTEVDPVIQTLELYGASKKGIPRSTHTKPEYLHGYGRKVQLDF